MIRYETGFQAVPISAAYESICLYPRLPRHDRPEKQGVLRIPGIINSLIVMETLFYKIPPNLPLPKGGIIPLFGKEGRGEIF
jgi:hypothetical protein